MIGLRESAIADMAETVATDAGHRLGRWIHQGGKVYRAYCEECGEYIEAHFGTGEIGGPAAGWICLAGCPEFSAPARAERKAAA